MCETVKLYPGKWESRDGGHFTIEKDGKFWKNSVYDNLRWRNDGTIADGRTTPLDLVTALDPSPPPPLQLSEGMWRRKDGTIIEIVKITPHVVGDLLCSWRQKEGWNYTDAGVCPNIENLNIVSPLINAPGKYVRRDGKVVEVTRVENYSGVYIWNSGSTHQVTSAGRAYIDEGSQTSYDLVAPYTEPPAVPITKAGVYKFRNGEEREFNQTWIERNQGTRWNTTGYDCFDHSLSPYDVIEFLRPLHTPLAAPSKYGLGRYKMRNGKLAEVTSRDTVAFGTHSGDTDNVKYYQGQNWDLCGAFLGCETESKYDLVQYLGPLVPEKTREQKLTEARENAVEQVRKWYARVNANRSQPRTQAQKEFYEVARILSDLEDEIPF